MTLSKKGDFLFLKIEDMHRKNEFAEISKNLTKYRFKNNFV